jgi:hypothetical protein
MEIVVPAAFKGGNFKVLLTGPWSVNLKISCSSPITTPDGLHSGALVLGTQPQDGQQLSFVAAGNSWQIRVITGAGWKLCNSSGSNCTDLIGGE